MPVVVIGKTAVAARLLRYTEKEKAGGTEPRVLYSEGILCRVPTAEREFAAVRRVHGKQGAKRKAPAKYELPEPGEVATYVRRARPNGRKHWAVAGAKETATHVRREGDGYVDESQAVHTIVSYGLDEVNPDDSEQVRQAFEFVVTMMTELYPGIQMKLVGQADGVGNAFHVHVVQNAVVVEDMEVDGQVWEAGRKLSGALTDIGRLRERADEFTDQHGAEYGIEQKLPSVTEQKAENRRTRDRRMAAKGRVSNHDIIRAAFETAMDDPRSVDLDSFVAVMSEHDVTVNRRIARAGKPGETNTLSYRLDDMKTPVRGTTLGDHYAFESAVQQLKADASGQERERRPEQQRVGAPKPLLSPTTQELADAQAVVKRLALEERTAQTEDRMNADFFPAITEDFDSAMEASRVGDFEELTRLATATREKESQRKAQRAQITTTSSPVVKAQAPSAVPARPQEQVSTWRARMHVALEEAGAQSQALSDRMINEYLREKETAKAADREQLAHAVIQPEHETQTTSPPGMSPTDLQRDPESPEAAVSAHEPEGTPAATPEAESIGAATAADETPLITTQEASPHLAAARKRLARLRTELGADKVEGEPSAEGPDVGR